MKMAQAFSRAISKGHHSVKLFANKSKPRQSQDKICEYYDVEENFELIDVRRYPVPMLWNFFYAAQLVYRIAKMDRPDVLYGRHAFSLFVLSFFFSGIKIAYEAHALPMSRFHRFIEQRLMAAKSFTRLIVISKALKDDYLKTCPAIKEAQIIVAHDGADIPVTQDKAPATLAKQPLKALYCGRLTTGKGLGLLERLIPLCPDIEFHIIGGQDHELADWKQKIAAPNAIFHGHIAHKDLPPYYAAMDVMLAPLQEKNEVAKNYDIGRWTSPLKIFEYMSYAKPVIASDLPVLKEILNHGDNAYLVPPDAPHAWKETLSDIQQHPEKAQQTGQKAFDDFCSQYTWQNRAQKIIEVLVSS